MYLAQSTVSSHISALAEALRVSLFRRESKLSIELAADGKRVYEYAKDVVSKCAAPESSAVDETRRELVLGASTAPPKGLLPSHVLQFTQSHPECRCVIRGSDSEHIIGRGETRENIAFAVVDSVIRKVASQAGKLAEATGAVCLTGGLCQCDYVCEAPEKALGRPVRTCADGRSAGAVGAALSGLKL